MSKAVIVTIFLILALLLDSLAGQSGVLSIIDFAGLYLILVWFNLSPSSEEMTWLLCLAISIVFGLFRQQNLGLLILCLTIALTLGFGLWQLTGRNFDYHLVTILGFFSTLAVASVIVGSEDMLRALVYIVINSVLAYVLQFLVMRNEVGNTRHSHKYK